MSRNTKSDKHGFFITTWMVIAVSIIYILIGLLLIFVPDANVVYLFYAIAAILLIFGIGLIVRYLLSRAYQNLGNYGFSVGISCVLIGICVLLKAAVLSSYLPLFLGVCILFGAMIKLQNAIDLRCAQSRAWLVFLILAFAFIAASLAILLNPFDWQADHSDIIYYILVADGGVGIVGTCYVGIAIKLFFKQQKKRFEMEEADREMEIEARAERKAAEKQRARAEDSGQLAQIAEHDDDPEIIDLDQTDGDA